MIPTLAVSNAQQPAPAVQISALPATPAAPTESAARITFNAVSPNIATQNTNNNRNASSGVGETTAASTLAPVGNATSFNISTPPGTVLSFSLSTPFVAQLFGQSPFASPANDNSFAASLLEFTPQRPTPNPELLAHFADTRYLPSNAARPAPTPQGVAAIANIVQSDDTTAATNTGIRFSDSTTQLINQALNAQGAQTVAFTGSALGSSAIQTTSGANSTNFTTGVAPERNSQRLSGSLRSNGIDAYIATFARSEIALSDNSLLSVTPIRL